MRKLLSGGYVYIAQPPLYSTKVGTETVYLKDDRAKEAFLSDRPNHRNEFQRLKGLGEMDAARTLGDHHESGAADVAACLARRGRHGCGSASSASSWATT